MKIESRVGYIPLKGGHIPYNIDPQALFLGCNDLGDAEKITLLAMASFDHAKVVIDSEGNPDIVRKGYCDVSVDKLAKYRGKDPKTIRAHLRRLEEYGLLYRASTMDSDDDCSNNSSTRKYFDYSRIYWDQEYVDDVSQGMGVRKRLSDGFISKEDSEDENMEPDAQKCEPVTKNNVPGPYINEPNNKKYNNTINIVEVTTAKSEQALEEIPSTNGNINELAEEVTPNQGPIRVSVPEDEIDLSVFAVGEVKSTDDPKKPKVKGVFKKIEAGQLGMISSMDLIEYFNDKYIKKYKLVNTIPVSQRPQVMNMLRNGFLARYGAQRCLKIIDDVFDFYEKAGLANDKYPRPTILSLTQDWLINKLQDEIEKNKRVEKIKEDRQAAEDYEDVQGQFKPFTFNDLTPNQRLRVNHLKYSQYFSILASNGYLPDLWINDLETNPDICDKYIQEGAIPLWNKNNSYTHQL